MDARERKKIFTYSERSNIDWHVHTTASDGRLSPTEIVKRAKELGLEEIAITDHDTVEGIKEAMREGKRQGVKIIPGIELTCYEKWGNMKGLTEVHVKGLDMDFKDKGLKKLISRAKKAREIRARKMVKKLEKLGYSVSWKRVYSMSHTIGRPHIARAFLENKDNIEKFKKKYHLKHEPSTQDVFIHLIGEGKPAYAEKMQQSVKHAIKVIHDARGLADLAHPGRTDLLSTEVPLSKIKEYKSYGLDAMEVYYALYRNETIKRFKRIADNLGLIATGGTDFHAYHPNRTIPRYNGSFDLGVGFGNMQQYWKVKKSKDESKE